MTDTNINDQPQYQSLIVAHAGYILMATAIITGLFPLVLIYFHNSLDIVLRPFAEGFIIIVLTIIAATCYSLSTIIMFRWFRSRAKIIRISSISVFLLTLLMGLPAAEMLRVVRSGGVIIDTRQTPELVRIDRALPSNTVVIIDRDGRTVTYKSQDLNETLLRSMLRTP
jgi:hypothetical protein